MRSVWVVVLSVWACVSVAWFNRTFLNSGAASTETEPARIHGAEQSPVSSLRGSLSRYRLVREAAVITNAAQGSEVIVLDQASALVLVANYYGTSDLLLFQQSGHSYNFYPQVATKRDCHSNACTYHVKALFLFWCVF